MDRGNPPSPFGATFFLKRVARQVIALYGKYRLWIPLVRVKSQAFL